MLRFIIAFILGKLAKLTLKLLGKRATHFPGKLAWKICPDFLKYVGKPETIVCVTGTNGKTSTCNLIEDSLRKGGVKILDNSFGSNTTAGICAVCIDGVTLFNKPKYPVYVLEIDERSSPHIYKHITPTYFVCTNLFRDSLTRNAHTEYIFSIIEKWLPESTTLILNGDDIISSRLGKGKNKNRVFFGVDKLTGEATEDYNIINDGRTCPECGAEMIFDFKRYHHIGRGHCSLCGMKSPYLDYRVKSVDEGNMTLKMDIKGSDVALPLINTAVFNVYNEAAATAFLTEYGFKPGEIASFMGELKITETRLMEDYADGVKVTCSMLKGLNPVACSRNCHTAQIAPGTKSVFFTIDDLHYKNENSSWLYEADLEALCHSSIKNIYICGPRYRDLRYRMLLAGIPAEKIVYAENEAELIKKLDFTDLDTLFVFFDMSRFSMVKNTVLPDILAAGRKKKGGAEKNAS